jgi:hypothetical protein
MQSDDEIRQQQIEFWHASFDEALLYIETCCNHEDPQMRRLSRWLMKEQANSYSFLQGDEARAYSSADHFAGLLKTIHHALFDDGEITFVAVNGRPMIVFADRTEVDNVELRNSTELLLANRRGVERKYEQIGGVDAFIERREQYTARIAEGIRLRQAALNGTSNPKA